MFFDLRKSKRQQYISLTMTRSTRGGRGEIERWITRSGEVKEGSIKEGGFD